MTMSSTFSSRMTLNKNSVNENLFAKIEGLERLLEIVRGDLFRLDEEAKSIQEEKNNVENYLEERAENTKNRLMGDLRKFESEVKASIDQSKKETAKLDEKINFIKQGQLNSLQLILSMQRRVKELEVQLGEAE